jgi:GTP pyrophosphokinase
MFMTPKGEMKILPKGATALDFAFSIHSDVGYHCVAIKINNKLVPMGYKLNNGDQIFITTNKNQKPSEDWLKLVVTGKAKAKIRSSLKEEKKQVGSLGKEALERKLKKLKVDFEDNVDLLVKHFNQKSRVDLYYQISLGKINLSTDLKIFDAENQKLIIKEEEKPVEEEVAPIKPRTYKGNPKLLINGEPGEQYNYKLAYCCQPVMGDDIFAYISSTSGLKIHRTTCPNATHLMANYGYRIMKAEWVYTGDTSFIVDIAVTGVDDGPGVIERLTNQISSNLGLNIRSFSIEGKEGYFEGKVSLVVQNTDQIRLAMRAIKKMQGISNVSRIS